VSIFVGGMLRWLTDSRSRAAATTKRNKPRRNVGILIASGLIAGEALTGLLFAYFKAKDIPSTHFRGSSYLAGCRNRTAWIVMVRVPLSKADAPMNRAPAP